MKTLIAYSSRTGNTKKVAEAINEVVDADIIDIANIDVEFDLEQYDNIIIGYWADKGKADQVADEFLRKIENKNCGVFMTLGARDDDDHAKSCLDYSLDILREKNNIISTFICRGKIDPKLTKKMQESGDKFHHPWTKKRAQVHQEAALHPNEKDFENARNIFRDFEEKASK